MSFSFRTVAIAASVICFALALIWMLFPQLLLWIWQIDGPEPALLVARRGGALFLGFGAMLLLARDAGPSPARSAIAGGLALGCAALAVLSVYELAAGHAGIGIALAIIVEVALALAFARVRHAKK